jgi:hypothetical protein
LEKYVAAAPNAWPTDDSSSCEVSYRGGEATARPDYHIPAVRPVPVPEPLEEKEHLALEEESYVDIYNILKDENSCSEFFGGPVQAIEVFNELARRLKKVSLGDRTIAVQMTGEFGYYKNNRSGASYRMFDRATWNVDGPLNRMNHLSSRGSIKNIGSFHPRSRQAKALVFLHELGHLVQGSDGNWLLPNDGNNVAVSQQNTKRIEDICSKQLAALK